MENIFKGCMPALITPCNEDLSPNFDLLVQKAEELINFGMSAVIYCGSMGDWPLLSDEERQEGVARLVKARIPTVVGTGAINTKKATDHASHAQKVGALGLMVIPRVLSRGPSLSAQRSHFASILKEKTMIRCKVFKENITAKELAKLPKLHPRTKHTTIQYHYFHSWTMKGLHQNTPWVSVKDI